MRFRVGSEGPGDPLEDLGERLVVGFETREPTGCEEEDASGATVPTTFLGPEEALEDFRTLLDDDLEGGTRDRGGLREGLRGEDER